MAEEQKNWEETTNHTPCANNCGFFGSPTTLDLCSKCHKHHHHSLNEQQHNSRFAPTQHHQEISSSGSVDIILSQPDSVPEVVVKSQPRNRCGLCKRRVGLTGFTCRCGTTFCGTHRYPEKHGCTFDYKTVGKEAIAKENPVIKAEKLYKI